MAQVVSRRPLTAEAPIRAVVSPCGICGRQSGTGIGCWPSSVLPSHCQCHPTVASHTRVSSGGWTNKAPCWPLFRDSLTLVM
jgi:hypothetical protein